tara:strand:- start:1652 stop:2371 length:720 start_codon:yes stop_codon:yes gene_type:complete
MNKITTLYRINRYIAMCGVCSRRKADSLIKNGDIKINGKVVQELGYKINRNDHVTFNGKLIKIEKKRYILLNKPKDFITTMSDERGRKTVITLIKNSCKERLVPVGRLDRNTTGLLLFTNDGDLAKKMSHPRFGVKKTYNVEIDKDLSLEHFEKIKSGVMLDDGVALIDKITYLEKKNKITIQLHIGRNRIIRRIFEHFNYKVLKLDRIQFSIFTKKNLQIGKWRKITSDELKEIKSIS